MRTSTGLAVTAVGAILLLAVHIPLPYLSLKIAGLVLVGTGLAGLEIPQQASGWVLRHQQQVMTVPDPGGDTADEPRVPLDTLLDADAADAAAAPEPAADVPGPR